MDDAELSEFPVLAEAVSKGARLPIVLVGDEVKSPPGITVYWIEEQLELLDSVAAGSVAGGGE